MTQLFINGREVALPAGFAATITAENPYFTGAGSFTDEIELPLVGINATIFGPINRYDVTMRVIKYDARLLVDNRIIMEGSATITSVNDTSISVQLLGDNSQVNFESKFDGIYIDEMELGYICSGLSYTYTDVDGDHTVEYHDKYVVVDDVMVVSSGLIAYNWESMSTSDKRNKLMGDSSDSNFVVLPAYADGGVECDGDAREITRSGSSISSRGFTDRLVNMPTYKINRDYSWTDSTVDTIEFSKTSAWPSDTLPPGVNWREGALSDYVEGTVNVIIPQPYLCHVIERFVAELGYTLTESCLRTEWTRRIYIVNVTNTAIIQDILPHWSATKFMSECEKLLGVIFWFDSINMTCKIRTRSNSFDSTVKDVVVSDDFSVDVNEDETTDISNSNVKIDYGSDLLHHFDDTLNEYMHPNECTGMAGVNSFFLDRSTGKDGEPLTSSVALRIDTGSTADRCRQYIVKDNVITQCNQMSDLIRKEGAEEVELGIVPAQMKAVEAYVYYTRANTRGNSSFIYKTENPIYLRCPVSKCVPRHKSYLNLGKYIDGDDEIEDNTIDKIYVAMFDRRDDYIPKSLYAGDGDHLNTRYVEENMGWVYENDDLSTTSFIDKGYTLQLTGDPSIKTLSENWTDNAIDTTKTHTVKIYTQGIIDVRMILIINGKRYVIKSVKYTADVNGLGRSAECTCYKID